MLILNYKCGIWRLNMSVQPDASDDTADLFAEEKPVSVAPEPQAEEAKTPEPKDPVAPSV